MTTEATPSGVRVLAHLPDGTEVNVTEGVMALYDLVLGSMDWGSGFWTAEDAEPVVHVGKTCGFAQVDEAERYVAERKHSEEKLDFYRQTWPPINGHRPGWVDANPAHEHIYSTVGRCMWPRCDDRDTDLS